MDDLFGFFVFHASLLLYLTILCLSDLIQSRYYYLALFNSIYIGIFLIVHLLLKEELLLFLYLVIRLTNYLETCQPVHILVLHLNF